MRWKHLNDIPQHKARLRFMYSHKTRIFYGTAYHIKDKEYFGYFLIRTRKTKVFIFPENEWIRETRFVWRYMNDSY